MTIDRSAPVLVTGSAGRIGRAAVDALTAAGWRVRGFDRMPTPGAAESITGDLTDAEALRRATRDEKGVSPADSYIFIIGTGYGWRVRVQIPS